MINPFLEINWRPGTPELRKFALTLIVCLMAIACGLALAIFGYGEERLQGYLTASAIGGAALTLGLVFPPLLRLLYYPWFALGASIGLVIANVLLMFFYFTFFSLYALGLHFSGRTARFLCSGWRECSEKKPESYFRQY